VFLVRDYLYTRLDKQPQDFIEKPAATPGTPTAQFSGAEEPEEEPAEEELEGADQGEEPPGAEQD